MDPRILAHLQEGAAQAKRVADNLATLNDTLSKGFTGLITELKHVGALLEGNVNVGGAGVLPQHGFIGNVMEEEPPQTIYPEGAAPGGPAKTRMGIKGVRQTRQGTQLSAHLEEAIQKKHILVYCDGSALNNGSAAQVAGSGALVVFGDRMRVRGAHIPGGTNNMGELIAIKVGLQIAEEIRIEENAALPVIVVSDSEYAINIIFNNFNAKANKDVVFDCRALKNKLGDVEAHWVRGHGDNGANKIVDFIAYAAANGRELKVDHIDTSKVDDPETLIAELDQMS